MTGETTRTRYCWFIIFPLFAPASPTQSRRRSRDLGLSPADRGIILGAFGIGYAITTLIGGFAVDRYGPRLVLTDAATLSSV
jgi:MFS transporter, ACS family, hexuronate transporter